MPRIYDSRVKRLGVAGAWAALYEKFVIQRGPDECWGWSGATHEYGYGHMTIWKVGSRRAHQIADEMAHGSIPAGMYVLHLCHRPECSNPAHLVLGTQRVNMRMAHDAGRMPHKISLADMTQIRARRQAGETLEAIGRDYGCSKQAVRYRLRTS